MIEAGTYMIAAAAAGGRVRVCNVIPRHMDSVSAKIREMGVTIEEGDDWLEVSRSGPLGKVNVKTMPYPGFPTDVHPQMSVLLCLADGVSIMNESVFDNRFQYINELRRMGADVKVEGKIATFTGVPALSAAKVTATDLRGGAAVIIAGLTAEGTTEVDSIQFIERGYDDIVQKLRDIGADIQKRFVPETSGFGVISV
jgi:UDP-N-acetylglucosamine 1-carboxyvinyltransferase